MPIRLSRGSGHPLDPAVSLEGSGQAGRRSENTSFGRGQPGQYRAELDFFKQNKQLFASERSKKTFLTPKGIDRGQVTALTRGIFSPIRGKVIRLPNRSDFMGKALTRRYALSPVG